MTVKRFLNVVNAAKLLRANNKMKTFRLNFYLDLRFISRLFAH